MSHVSERGAATERGLRSSALWGTGTRGGDSRSSALWGKGGRGIGAVLVLVCALAVPIAATAAPGKGAGATTPTPAAGPAPGSTTFVAKSLRDKAKNSPDQLVDVIIQSAGGVDGAKGALKGLGNLKRELKLVGAVSASLPAKKVEQLQANPGLIVTPDAPMKVDGLLSSLRSGQLWPYESGNALLWGGDQAFYASRTPAIAIIDSGVQQRADFGSRIVASVNLSTIDGNTSLDDERGHGTFVAGIAAGGSADLAGADPVAPIVSIKVMDGNGMAKTSDVINACQWLLDHKAQYNIRVANFSMHSSYGTNFYRDPLDRAVEKLWFGGVTVVAAAGNYGTASGPSGVLYSPGNDPFVITVGAVDINGTVSPRDDSVAPWSAYGYTYDGFYKPEVAAPGRYIVGAVAPGSSLTVAKATNLVGTDRIQLSGTSFSAPVVAGTAAQILARHPSWTPDQVKGVLMRTARKVTGTPAGAGVGQITASRAAAAFYAPNANLSLDRFVTTDATTGQPTFDSMSWSDTAKADMSWSDMSWSDQSWSDMSWSDQSWASMSWSDMSWSDMSWSDMSWSDQSSSDASQEDANETDTLSGAAGYELTPIEESVAQTDPDLNVPVDETP